MKILLTGTLLFAVLSVGTAQDKQDFSQETGNVILLGQGDRNDLESQPFSDWFDAEYENYQIDNETLSLLRNKIKMVKITIFMGTWCSDSRREVPRFFKILDALDVPEENINMYFVDVDKTCPDIDVHAMDIQFVPTFIFSREDTMLGRIVESPSESLEKDMKNILYKE